MKILIVLTLEVPNPEAVPAALTAIDPPNVPGFAGVAHLVVEPHATELEKWLDA